MKKAVITGIIIVIVAITAYISFWTWIDGVSSRLDEDIKKSEEALRGYGVNPNF
jgi:biopolymer transport protein ExbB/TolQ